MSLESFADDLSSAKGGSGSFTPSAMSLRYRLRNLIMYLSVIASSISSVQLASRHISSSCPSRCPSNPPTKPNLMSLMPKFSTLDATSNSDALLRQSTASCCPFSPKYPFGSWLPGAYDFSVKSVMFGSSGSPATSGAFERQCTAAAPPPPGTGSGNSRLALSTHAVSPFSRRSALATSAISYPNRKDRLKRRSTILDSSTVAATVAIAFLAPMNE